jgi:hypothetical protein
MYLHANAKLGLAGRLALVRTIEGGCSVRAAAAAFAGAQVGVVGGAITEVMAPPLRHPKNA